MVPINLAWRSIRAAEAPVDRVQMVVVWKRALNEDAVLLPCVFVHYHDTIVVSLK